MKIITNEGKIEISRKRLLTIEVEGITFTKHLKVGEVIGLTDDVVTISERKEETSPDVGIVLDYEPVSSPSPVPSVISTLAPLLNSTSVPPLSSTIASPSNSTSVPPLSSTIASPSNSTSVPPLSSTIASPPSSTIASPPSSTIASPPSSTIASPPSSTSVPLPNSTSVPPPNSTIASPPNSTIASPPNSTIASPPNFTSVPPPNSTIAPTHVSLPSSAPISTLTSLPSYTSVSVPSPNFTSVPLPSYTLVPSSSSRNNYRRSFFDDEYEIMIDSMIEILQNMRNESINDYINRRIQKGWNKCTIFFDDTEYEVLKKNNYYDLTPIKKYKLTGLGPDFIRFWNSSDFAKKRHKIKIYSRFWHLKCTKIYLPIILKKK